MRGLYLFIVFLPFFISCQTERSASKYPAQIGDIAFDAKLDDPEFKRCTPENRYTYQYYNDSRGFEYKGEKYAIINKLNTVNLHSAKNSNGYIIIRFLVNCEGKTGLFRAQQIDRDYNEVSSDDDLKDKLLIFTKSLDGWLPKQIEGKKIDYYQYINYKIVDGKVSEILP